jgi:hypothetical protein
MYTVWQSASISYYYCCSNVIISGLETVKIDIKQGVRLWAGFIGLRIGIRGRLLRTR